MNIAAFDPGARSTGWAVADWNGGALVQLLEHGLIRTSAGKPLPVRIAQLVDEGRRLIVELEVRLAIIEYPATRRTMPGAFGARSAVHLPAYGIAVGAVDYGVCGGIERERISVTEWTALKWVPGTNKDPKKTKRVAAAESMYGVELGAPTTAGDQADALLMLAAWQDLRAQRQRNPG